MSESEMTGEPTTENLARRLRAAVGEGTIRPTTFDFAATRLESLQRDNDALRRRLEALEVESLKAEEPE